MTYTDQDFSGQNLSGRVLCGTFIRCSFRGCNLRGAVLDGVFIACDFAGADLGDDGEGE